MKQDQSLSVGGYAERAKDQAQLNNIEGFVRSDKKKMQQEAKHYGKAFSEGTEDQSELAKGYAKVNADQRDIKNDANRSQPVRY